MSSEIRGKFSGFQKTYIDTLVDKGIFKSRSEYLRHLVVKDIRENLGKTVSKQEVTNKL